MKYVHKLLVNNLLTLLLILAGGILAFMHINIKQTIADLSSSLISSTQNRTEAELEHFFAGVSNELLKACKMGEQGMLDELEIEALNKLFVPLLWQSHQISSIQIGSSEGVEYMLLRRDSLWINRRIAASGQRNWTHWVGLETATPKLIESTADQKATSPQSKEWFTNAANQAGTSYWSAPYRFNTAQNTGLTISRQFNSRTRPDVTYVIAVDVLLEDVSRFTMGLKMSENDREFIITSEGNMVGIPRDPRGKYSGFFKEFLLQPAAALYIPPLTAAVDIWQESGSNLNQIFEFQSEGERWWAGIRPFELEDQQLLFMGVIVPEKDFLPSVQRTRTIINLGWVLITALILVIGFSYYRQRQSQKELAEKNQQIATEQRQRELERERTEKLQQLDKLKDQFLANTSHELRTPLNGIIGITESLYDDPDRFPPEELRKNLSLVITSGRRLANLVNDILDFSKLKNHQLTLNTRAVDLWSHTDVVLQLIAPLVRNKNVILKNKIAPELPPVEADDNRLQQILYNLVGNAIKFTEKGEVAVEAKLVEKKVRLYVRDTGIGIPKDQQEVIFSSFEQGAGDTARKYGGTGLGLSVTSQLVAAHGGYLEVDSEEGAGSVFYFDLPISGKPLVEASPDLATNMSRSVDQEEGPLLFAKDQVPYNSAIRILIVDDEPINLQVLINHLSASNYSLQVAHSGQEALDLLEQGNQYDLVLLDVMMPNMSGYEVCERIRAKYLPSELPVIMITAKNQVIDLVQGLSYGANDYLSKPFSKNEFLARVKTHLRLANINAAYGRFVPHEFLRALGHESIMDVKIGDQIERVTSVLFSDIRSYTTLSEDMIPEDNFKFINAYLGRMAPVIKEHHGMINQFLGDGIMALFPNSPADSIGAAIEMHQALALYNMERKKKNWLPIRVGMGIHTGPLIMGILGDYQRMEASIIADTVNTASRLEGLTKHFHASLIVSEDTRKLINDPNLFNHRFLAKVQVKGKKLPVGIYEFFDGDAPELIEQKVATKMAFEQGLMAYFKQDFEIAKEAFETVLQQFPGDHVSQHYLRQIVMLKNEGIPEDWTGVERMSSK